MFKKVISVVLTLIMIFGAVSVTASAADVSKQVKKIESAVGVAFGALVDADEDAVVVADEALNNKIIKENGTNMTVSQLSKAVSSFVLVPYTASNKKEVAEKIAAESIYTVTVLSSGEKTVYIAVDISENPELFKIEVFHDAVIAMCEKQSEVIGEEDANAVLLDYNRLAGELALHMIVYNATKPFAKLSPQIEEIYEHAKVANLNIDEDRAPQWIMSFIGFVFMRIFYMLRNVI